MKEVDMSAEFTSLQELGDVQELNRRIEADTIAVNTELISKIAKVVGYNCIQVRVHWPLPAVSSEVGATAMQLAQSNNEQPAFTGAVADDSYNLRINLRQVWFRASEHASVQPNESFAWGLHTVLVQGMRAAPILTPRTRLPVARVRLLTVTNRLAKVMPDHSFH